MKEIYKVAIMGSGGVGKSSLTIRFVASKFITEYDPTIEDVYSKAIDLDGSPCMLDILDTAGQEEFIELMDSWIHEGQGYLLVFNIANKNTLHDLHKFADRICRAKEVDDMKSVNVVLVGNKCDLRNPSDGDQVMPSEAKAIAKEWGCKYIECSALKEINNDEIFYEIARRVRATENGTTKKKRFASCELL